MKRLLLIEWFKLKSYRPFWVLIGMYALAVTIVCSSGNFLLQYLENQGAEFEGITPTLIPLYDFPDVWHNITYVAGFFRIFLGFIMVISIANESNFRTLRQNVIDGLSNKEFLLSKLLLAFSLALASTVLIFLIGLNNGLYSAHPDSYQYMFESLDFLGANLLGVFAFLSFAMLLTFILPKPGLVIVGLFLYAGIFEPTAAVFLREFPHLNDFYRPFAEILPVSSIANLIHIPFPRYIFREIQDFVSLKEVGIVLVWLAIYIFGSYWVLQRKDW